MTIFHFNFSNNKISKPLQDICRGFSFVYKIEIKQVKRVAIDIKTIDFSKKQVKLPKNRNHCLSPVKLRAFKGN